MKKIVLSLLLISGNLLAAEGKNWEYLELSVWEGTFSIHDKELGLVFEVEDVMCTKKDGYDGLTFMRFYSFPGSTPVFLGKEYIGRDVNQLRKGEYSSVFRAYMETCRRIIAAYL